MSVQIPVQDVARFDIRAVVHGQPVETSCFFRKLVPPITQAALDLEVTRMRSIWDSALFNRLGSDVVRNEIFAVDLSPSSTITSSTTVFFGASFLGPSLPNDVAFSLMPVGPTIPRPWQWRFRLFGVPKSVVEGDIVDPMWAEQLRVLLRDRYTLQGAFGWRCVVVQRVVGGVPLLLGVPYDITDYTIPTLVVSPMRRRLR